MRKFFAIYQYVVPLLFFPFSYYLWLRQTDYNHPFVILVLSIPVLTGYIVLGIAANYCKVLEYHTSFKLGKYTFLHGFMFGGGSGLLAFVCVDLSTSGISIWELLRTGFVLGSVMAFWEWLFGAYVIKSGFGVMYNKQHYENQSAEAIAGDYAGPYFVVFGFCYGIAIRLSQYYLLELGRNELYLLLIIMSNISVMVIPVIAFAIYSYLKNGYSGLRPYTHNTETQTGPC